MDTASTMARLLYEEGIDLTDEPAVERALIDGNFRTSHITVFKEDAIHEAREMFAEEDRTWEFIDARNRRAA